MRHTLMAGCVARTPFRDQVEAAGRAGFSGISTWPNIWRHARAKGGLSLRDMRAMLEDNGLALEQVEAIPEWPPNEEVIAVCAELGGGMVVAMRFGDMPLDLAREADTLARFAALAGTYSLRAAIEFVAFSTIPDAVTAWRLVELSGSDAALVVDLAHHRRGGGDDAALFAIPPDRIASIQLADGPAQAPEDLLQEASTGRLWPGEGDFGVAGFVNALKARGVEASIGLELYQPAFAAVDASQLIGQLEKEGRIYA